MKITRSILSVLLFVLLIVGLTKNVWSAYLTLNRIGSLSTAGLSYTTYSVTGVIPDFSGAATPSAMVAVTVNAVTATTSAGLNGIWTVSPTNIVPGSNSVSIASGNESISFVLSYSPAATPTVAPPVATTSALPEAGGFLWPFVIVATGIVVFVAGRQVKSRVDDEWNI